MRLPVSSPYDQQRYITTEFAEADPNAYFGKHAGIDIGTPVGTPLYAAVSGEVSIRQDNIYHGNALDIQSGDKWYRTMHMKAYAITGGRVSEGDLIGWSGNTGVLSVGGSRVDPHLHFDVRNQYSPKSFSSFINPKSLLTQGEHMTATRQDIINFMGALWGANSSNSSHTDLENHIKNWEGKEFSLAFNKTFEDPRTFAYADKCYKAINGGNAQFEPINETTYRKVTKT